MWLLRLTPRIGSSILNAFYDLAITGPGTPDEGPLLLVANHPNMVADPGIMLAAAGRPVRFLAKSPLFRNPILRWLLQAVGTLPVYRPRDEDEHSSKNEETFAAVQAALMDGASVGIFPEGTSHDAPSLMPLRTGAARIALGCTPETRRRLAIVPIGIVYRRKERFRSKALAIRGEPIDWDDLRDASLEPEAVRRLTERIDQAIREVTINLDQWEDAPLIECVESVYAGELDLPRDRASRARRAQQIAEALRHFRSLEPQRIENAILALEDFRRASRAAGIRPDRIDETVGWRVALHWSLITGVAMVLAAPVLIAGHVLFFVPYTLSSLLARVVRVERESRATLLIFGGGGIYAISVSMLSWLVGHQFGFVAGAMTFAGLPVLAFVTVRLREWAIASLRAARRFLLLRSSDSVRSVLLEQRRDLMNELETLREAAQTATHR